MMTTTNVQMNRLVIAAALGLSLAACGSSIAPAAKAKLDTGMHCAAVSGPSVTVAPATTGNCVECSTASPELAADGDLGTAATVSIPAATGGGASIRITDGATTFAAGQKAGVIAAFRRAGSLAVNPYAFVRTYLHDQLQEESTLTATSGVNNGAASVTPVASFFGFETTKPFDAIEIAVESQAVTGYFDLEVYEACSQFSVTGSGAVDPVGLPAGPAAVIADLSTGANPYHHVFRRPDWTQHPSSVIPGFPADAPALELSLGDNLEKNLETDAAKWESLQTGVVYWIPHTNLLYVRTRQSDEAFPGTQRAPAYQTADHGVLTSGVVAKACPSCYLLIVSDPEGGFTASLDYLAQNAPWVDVAASTQQATTLAASAVPEAANGLVLSQLRGPLSDYAQAAKRWVESGKLYFVGSGNFPVGVVGYPVPVPTTDRTVPPWFTVIGGGYAECRATELDAGKPAEFISEYQATAPVYESTDEYQAVSGTSFSTPLVATHFAQALKRLRAVLGDTRQPGVYWAGTPRGDGYLADGVLTRDELYSAFADAADLFQTSEYSGPCGSNGVPPSPQPWVEAGWGYVGEAQGQLAADIILGLLQPPAKPAEQRQYMDSYLMARELSGL